jgi:hypothetical protein
MQLDLKSVSLQLDELSQEKAQTSERGSNLELGAKALR